MTTLHIVLLTAGGMITGIAAAIIILRPRISHLHRRLHMDATSGLLNYEGFLHYLKRHQKKEAFVLFLLDLDDFRRFNRQSYDTGDVVLKLFASRLSKKMNGIAMCARYRLRVTSAACSSPPIAGISSAIPRRSAPPWCSGGSNQ